MPCLTLARSSPGPPQEGIGNQVDDKGDHKEDQTHGEQGEVVLRAAHGLAISPAIVAVRVRRGRRIEYGTTGALRHHHDTMVSPMTRPMPSMMQQ